MLMSMVYDVYGEHDDSAKDLKNLFSDSGARRKPLLVLESASILEVCLEVPVFFGLLSS